MTATRASTLTRLLALPAACGITAAGLWASGGLISDDFTVSMWLTVGWMVFAAAVVVAVAARSRALRVPVIAGYVATAVAAGAYLGPSVLFDDVVDEHVATASPARPLAAAPAAVPPSNVLVRAGRFEPIRHDAAGDARVIRLAEGGRVLTLTDFAVANGPDLRVRLAAGPARDEGSVGDVVDIGALKGNKGDQQYRIPPGTDVGGHPTVVIWCRAFSVLFARAPLALPRRSDGG